MPGRTEKSRPEAEWERVKPFLKELYLEQDNSLHRVMAIMRQQHGFDASPKMYKSRFNKWTWRKYNAGRVMKAAESLRRERQKQGKQSTFRFQGRTFDETDVESYFRRQAEYEPKRAAPSPTDSFVEGLECFTPGSAAIDTRDQGFSNDILHKPSSEVVDSENPQQDMTEDPTQVLADNGTLPTLWSPNYDHATVTMTDPPKLARNQNDVKRTVTSKTETLSPNPGSLPLLNEISDEDDETQTLLSSPSVLLSNNARGMNYVNGVLINPPSVPTEHEIPEKMLNIWNSFLRGSFESGDWYSKDLKHCCEVRIRFPPLFSRHRVSNAIQQSLHHSIAVLRSGQEMFAIKSMDVVCELIQDGLRQIEPELLYHVLCFVLKSSMLGAHNLGRILLRLAFNYARVVFIGTNHPVLQCLALMSGHFGDVWIWESMLQLQQIIFNEHLTPLHCQCLLLRYIRLHWNGYESPDAASYWSDLAEDVERSLGKESSLLYKCVTNLSLCEGAVDHTPANDALPYTLILRTFSTTAQDIEVFRFDQGLLCVEALFGSNRKEDAEWLLGAILDAMANKKPGLASMRGVAERIRKASLRCASPGIVDKAEMAYKNRKAEEELFIHQEVHNIKWRELRKT